VAAFCFATAGLLDLIADRRLYHLFRFFGGVFGVASACTIGTQALASRITSAVSVHMFLMDAIAMLWIYKFGGTSLLVGKLMNVILAVGALSYLGGTLIDVVVSLPLFLYLRTNILFPSLYRARTLISNRLLPPSPSIDPRFPTCGFSTTRSTGT
jgi:hypothetical protein